MTLPVTHILVPIFIVETYRRYCARKKGKTFSKWWVLIAGFLGGAPDFDILYGWFMLGTLDPIYHRTITHSMFIPLAALVVGAVIYFFYRSSVLKYVGWKVSYSLLFLATIGFSTHVLLDGITGFVKWFYPLDFTIVLPGVMNLINTKTRAAILDGVLLLAWLSYDEDLFNDVLDFLKKKFSKGINPEENEKKKMNRKKNLRVYASGG
jgi:hypothetical protein